MIVVQLDKISPKDVSCQVLPFDQEVSGIFYVSSKSETRIFNGGHVFSSDRDKIIVSCQILFHLAKHFKTRYSYASVNQIQESMYGSLCILGASFQTLLHLARRFQRNFPNVSANQIQESRMSAVFDNINCRKFCE